MLRNLTGLVVIVIGLLFLSSRLDVVSAQSPNAWQDKVDPSVLAAANLGETDFLIYMEQQADLSGAANVSGKEAKGTYVYNQLTATAQQTQPAVTAVLDGLGASHKSFWAVNAILARGNLAAVQAVASLPAVSYISTNAEGTLSLPTQTEVAAAERTPSAVEWNIALVRAPEAWALGFTGQNVVVAGADTGVAWEHEALKGQYRGWNGVEADHDYNWHDAIAVPDPVAECPANSPYPCDDDVLLGGGHGTHTVGTMVGYDGGANQIGMAPGAEWIACRNMKSGVGVIATYMNCMQWFLAPTEIGGTNPDPAMAPHVINNSWGCIEGCDPNTPGGVINLQILRELSQNIRMAGIVFVASAGNDGPACSTIEFPPAVYPESFTVGATDNMDNIADFSSRGPSILSEDPLNPVLKPNISAPGVDVRSSLRDGSYDTLSGTSMAGPHVAGLVALIISANPALAGEVDAIENIIEQTAVPLTTDEACGGDTADQVPNYTYGWGRIDALAAVEAASTPTSVQLGGVEAQGGSSGGVGLWVAGALLAATGLTLLLRRARRA